MTISEKVSLALLLGLPIISGILAVTADPSAGPKPDGTGPELSVEAVLQAPSGANPTVAQINALIGADGFTLKVNPRNAKEVFVFCSPGNVLTPANLGLAN